ncbi:hypothetical protein CFN78_17660 [Amycolatopsis antarctica]|uniref:Molecular chaperone DnaK n=1 Tax=Amycolatopsis antarctica TaxID=1854586 RepID=A0A263D2W0_9PSEU|nr:hypothetical protein [Amycolatopsis antarctica]OZM71967.1 hypothetical protein CFN78_17660 [Amycolatopsis antarctica]
MPYTVGVDVGSRRVTVATCTLREDTADRAEVVPLGDHTASVPGALYLDDEGYVLFGDGAREAGSADPARLISGFHERIGDDVPIHIAGETFAAQSLSAVVVAWGAGQVATQRGEQPERIAVTHPGCWGPYRRRLLRAALDAEGLRDIVLVPVPVAVLHEHTRAGGPATAGMLAAVLEARPEQVTPALLHRSTAGWEPLACGDPAAPGIVTGAQAEDGADGGPAERAEACLDELRALGRQVPASTQRLGGIAVHGPAVTPELLERLRGSLPCRPVALPDPEITAACGAASVAASEILLHADSTAAAVTTVLPRTGTEDMAEPVPSRPIRPPLRIDAPVITVARPVRAPERRRPGTLASALVALVTLMTMLMLRGDLATADARPFCRPADGQTSGSTC